VTIASTRIGTHCALVVVCLVASLVVAWGQSARQAKASESVASATGGAIAGHVTDARSKPIDAYSVIVFSTDRAKWFPDSRSVTVARPAADGGFEVVGLPAGEYWVVAVDAIPGNQSLRELSKPEVLEKLSPHATRVAVADGGRYMTVLRLIRR
jgi:hypothetical protein